jgi:hypothetical protein
MTLAVAIILFLQGAPAVYVQSFKAAIFRQLAVIAVLLTAWMPRRSFRFSWDQSNIPCGGAPRRQRSFFGHVSVDLGYILRGLDQCISPRRINVVSICRQQGFNKNQFESELFICTDEVRAQLWVE